MTPSCSITPVPASESTNDATLLPALRSLADGGGAADHIFQKLFQVVLDEFKPLVARWDFRADASTRSELRHRSSLKRDDAERLADEYLAESLLDVQCSGRPAKDLAGVRVETHELGKTMLHAVCAPVTDLHSADAEGAIGLLIGGSREKAAAVAQQLATLTTVAASLRAGASASHRERSGDTDASRQFHGLSRASQFGSVRELAFTLVNSLASKFHCEQVAYGSVAKQRVEVLAVSGMAEIKSNSPGVLAIRQAMDECADQNCTLGWQRELHSVDVSGQQEEIFPLGLLHRQWAHECGGSSVLSLPLILEEEVIGVVSFRRNSKRPFTCAERRQIEQLCGQFSLPIRLIETASRPISRQITSMIDGAARKSFRRGALGRWIALALFLCVGIWFCLGTVQFQPRCTCEVAPETTLHFTAPFQAKLDKVHVKAGDEVKAGQLLAEFESRELRLEFESLTADLTAYEVDVRTALQENDVEKAALAQAKADVFRTRALASQNRLQRARLIAPADGRIIQCDSSKLAGQVLAQGDSVLQFAPHGGFVLKVHVPDGVATSVERGQAGIFASAARPDIPLPFQIRRVNSAAEVVNGANVFVAEAGLATAPGWLKAGMQGTVRIESSRQPVWWVATHTVADWMRMRFWL